MNIHIHTFACINTYKHTNLSRMESNGGMSALNVSMSWLVSLEAKQSLQSLGTEWGLLSPGRWGAGPLLKTAGPLASVPLSGGNGHPIQGDWVSTTHPCPAPHASAAALTPTVYLSVWSLLDYWYKKPFTAELMSGHERNAVSQELHFL